MQEIVEAQKPQFLRWELLLLAAIVLLAYGLQVPSPLRVNTDVETILTLTAKLTDHQPYLVNGQKPVFPIGVPLVFSLMERGGIATALGFNLFNLSCIIITAIASVSIWWSLGLRGFGPAVATILAFSNFVLLKHALLPLTDVPYLAASLLALAVLERAQDDPNRLRRVIVFVVAAGLVMAAIIVRRVGVALAPALGYFIWRQGKWARITGGLLCVIAVLFGVFRGAFYMPDFWKKVGELSVGAYAIHVVRARAVDLGEVLINAPIDKLHRVAIIFPIAGVMLLMLVVVGLWRARKNIRPSHIYLIFYMVILFAWPYQDNRFWLPVLPLFAIVIYQALQPWLNYAAVRRLIASYVVVYGAFFAIAAVYTTRITYSADFPDSYASGKLAGDYREAWSARRLTTPAAVVIRRYGMR